MPALIRMSPTKWEELGWDDNRPAHTPVYITNSDGDEVYAVSPDGIGSYYYATLEELVNDYIDLDKEWYDKYQKENN